MNSKPNSCIGCPYYDKAGPLYGTGSPDARIAFVADSPSAKDLGTMGVMADSAGNILDNSARKAQINRQREFTTYTVKCAPGPYVHPKAVEKCKTLLDQELNALRNLKVIATVGDESFRGFTGKKLTSVMSRKDPDVWLRGCVWRLGSKVIIPTMSPQFHMASGFTLTYQMDMDLQKVAKFANGKGNRYENKSLNYNPSSVEVQEYIRELQACGRGGLDIETPEVAGEEEEELTAGGQAYPIDVIGISAHVGESIGVPPDLYPLLEDMFGSVEKPIKWHVFNGAFDFYHIGKTFKSCRGVRIFDVMLALNRWRSDLTKKDLGMAMSFFTDMPFTKNLAKIDPNLYQWADVTGVLEAGMNLERVGEIQGWLKVLMENDHNLLNDLVNPQWDGLSTMRELGVRTDLQQVFTFLKISQDTLAQYEQTWNKSFPLTSWSSPKQLGELFCGVFKLPPQMRQRIKKKNGEVTRTKTITCDSKALEVYRDKYNNKVAGLVLAMRTIKHLGDFAGIIRPDTNRIHTAYMIHRQVQFRIQAKDPNLQTLPEKLSGFHTRKMVIADDPDNDLLISIDASQIELRIYAYVSKATALLNLMNAGIYIYGGMYEQIYKKAFFKPGLPKTKYNMETYVTPQEILAAKSGPLGFIYNRGADSLVQKLGMAVEASKEVYNAFHKENPEIKEFHKQCDTEVGRQDYLVNLWGGRRWFPVPKVQKNEYYSFPGQSNGSELLKQQYLRPSFQYLKSLNGSRVLLTVHDSMVINCKGGLRDSIILRDTAQFLYDQSEAPIPQMEGMIIPAEVKYGSNWAEMKLFQTTHDAHGRTVVLGK